MPKIYTDFDEFERDYDVDFADPDSYLNRGSFGEVVKGWDVINKQFVAIKRSLRSDDDSLRHEFEAARSLQHANVATYLLCCRLSARNVGTRDYLVMQFYPDGNLSQLIRKQTLTSDQIQAVVRGILEGLKYLHDQNRPHRDFKPANVLITRNRRGQFVPVITDFGSAKVTDSEGSQWLNSDHALTPSYAAPEQLLNGERVGFNIDLWAFGVVLYELLTGELPFGRLSNQQSSHERDAILRRMATAALPDRLNSIAQPYQAMIRRCLVRDQSQRVRRADELLDLLDDIPGLLTAARLHYQLRQYTSAQEKYQALLRLRPQHADAKRELTDCETVLQTTGPTSEEADDDVTVEYVSPQPMRVKSPAPEPAPKPVDRPPTRSQKLVDTAPVPQAGPNSSRIAGWQWAVLVGCVGGLLLAVFWFTRPDQATEPVAAPTTTIHEQPAPVAEFTARNMPTLNADSLFTATKAAFTNQGLDKQKAASQFKAAVDVKPELSEKAYHIFADKARLLRPVSPALAKEYQALADQFKL